MKAILYLRELKRNETIQLGDFHSLNKCELESIKNMDTIGQTPSEFSNERKFYRPTTIDVINK